jgi:hypothetical protein
VLIIPSSWGFQLIGHFHHHHRSNHIAQQIFGYTPQMGMPEGTCSSQLFYFLSYT